MKALQVCLVLVLIGPVQLTACTTATSQVAREISAHTQPPAPTSTPQSTYTMSPTPTSPPPSPTPSRTPTLTLSPTSTPQPTSTSSPAPASGLLPGLLTDPRERGSSDIPRHQNAGSRHQNAGSRHQNAGSRHQNAGSRSGALGRTYHESADWTTALTSSSGAPTLAPSASPTPQPTYTPLPTPPSSTPTMVPSPTPDLPPTLTPLPTSTPQPIHTPLPTLTPTPSPTASPTPTSSPTPAPTAAYEEQAAPALSDLGQEMVDTINRERQDRGLVPLQIDPVLDQLAQGHAQGMVDHGSYSHASVEGDSYRDRLEARDITLHWVGENFYVTCCPQDRAVACAMEWLMSSPPHRKNILNVHYRLVGVGVAKGDLGTVVFVQDFTE